MALFKLMDDDNLVLQKMAVHRNQNGVAVLRVLMHSCGETSKPITTQSGTEAEVAGAPAKV